MGSCSSLEQKYRLRKASDAEFDGAPEGVRRLKYGYDYDKQRAFEVRQVRTEHHDLENTILKMACKRAHVAMVLNVTAASDIFTQDIEDLPEELVQGSETPVAQAPIKRPRAKKKKSTPGSCVEASRDSCPEPAAQTAIEDRKERAIQAESPLLSAGQRRILSSRMKAANLGEAELVKRFGAALEALPATKFDEVVSWVRECAEAQP